MRLNHFVRVVTLAALALGGFADAQAQQVPQFRLTIPPPLVGFQTSTGAGTNVAMNSQYVAMGCPTADTDREDSGVVKVFHAASGELAFVIPAPEPSWSFFPRLFGSAIAISGSKLIVGAPGESSVYLAPGSNVGVTHHGGGNVYVFELDGTTPTVPILKLDQPNLDHGNSFGTCVAVSGSKVAVSAPGDSLPNGRTGAVHVYDLAGATPATAVSTIRNSHVSSEDEYGLGLALDGNTLAVYGVWFMGLNEEEMPQYQGAVQVFDLGAATPQTPIHELANSIGPALAISNGRLCIGNAWGSVSSPRGVVFVYQLGGANPLLPAHTISYSSNADHEFFGGAISLDDDQLVVGYLQPDDSEFGQARGDIRVYDLGSATPTEAVWSLTSQPPQGDSELLLAVANGAGTVAVAGVRSRPISEGESEQTDVLHLYDLSSATPEVPAHTGLHRSPVWSPGFGSNLACSGNYVAVDGLTLHSNHKLFVYDLAGNDPSTPWLDLGIHSGFAFSDSKLAVSRYQDYWEGSQVKVEVFDLSSAEPDVPVLTLQTAKAYDKFGTALDFKGDLLAVGAPGDEEGPDAGGTVYLYDLSRSNPSVPIAIMRKPNRSLDDGFGSSVELSGDLILVGNRRGSTYASDGSVDVYNRSNSAGAILVNTLRIPTGRYAGLFGEALLCNGRYALVDGDPPESLLYDLTKPNGSPPVSRFKRGSMASNDSLLAVADWNLPRVTLYNITKLPSTAHWTRVSSPVPIDSNSNGWEIDMDNTVLAIGDPNAPSPIGRKGAVHIFDLHEVIAPSEVSVPTSLLTSAAFGQVDVAGTPVSRELRITNAGTDVLTLDAEDFQLPASSEFFVFAPSLLALQPGESVGFEVSFDPRDLGARSAVLSIPYTQGASAGSLTFTLSGVGRRAKAMKQSITYLPPSSVDLNQSPALLTAYASSGLPVNLSILSGPASIVNGTLVPSATGEVRIKASQAGDGNYLPAADVIRKIAVKVSTAPLALVDLTHIYDGQPKAAQSIPSGAAFTYTVNNLPQSSAPTAAGRYAVKAALNGKTVTGVLTITKAPLWVTADNKRRLVGEANPTLSYTLSGFQGSDTSTVVTSAPRLKTTATAASPGGEYAITSTGGAAQNYLFIHRPGVLAVDSLAGAYEGLLLDDNQLPFGKVFISATANNRSFTGKLQLAPETAVLPLSGSLIRVAGSESVTAVTEVTGKSGTDYRLEFSLKQNGELQAALSVGAQTVGTTTDGRKVTIPRTSLAGYYTLYLGAGLPASSGPDRAGWAKGKIDTKGLLSLSGQLGDGTKFTASLSSSAGVTPGYRLFVQPYQKPRPDTFLGGIFHFGAPLKAGLRPRVGSAIMTWSKQGLATDASFKAGFGPLSCALKMEPWEKPSGGRGLHELMRIGLNGISVTHGATGSISQSDLPTSLAVSLTNVFSVSAPLANPTGWKLALNPTDGSFTGSCKLSLAGKSYTASFSGVLLQTIETSTTAVVLGQGFLTLPAVLSTNGVNTVELKLAR